MPDKDLDKILKQQAKSNKAKAYANQKSKGKGSSNKKWAQTKAGKATFAALAAAGLATVAVGAYLGSTLGQSPTAGAGAGNVTPPPSPNPSGNTPIPPASNGTNTPPPPQDQPNNPGAADWGNNSEPVSPEAPSQQYSLGTNAGFIKLAKLDGQTGYENDHRTFLTFRLKDVTNEFANLLHDQSSQSYGYNLNPFDAGNPEANPNRIQVTFDPGNADQISDWIYNNPFQKRDGSGKLVDSKGKQIQFESNGKITNDNFKKLWQASLLSNSMSTEQLIDNDAFVVADANTWNADTKDVDHRKTLGGKDNPNYNKPFDDSAKAGQYGSATLYVPLKEDIWIPNGIANFNLKIKQIAVVNNNTKSLKEGYITGTGKDGVDDGDTNTINNIVLSNDDKTGGDILAANLTQEVDFATKKYSEQNIIDGQKDAGMTKNSVSSDYEISQGIRFTKTINGWVYDSDNKQWKIVSGVNTPLSFVESDAVLMRKYLKYVGLYTDFIGDEKLYGKAVDDKNVDINNKGQLEIWLSNNFVLPNKKDFSSDVKADSPLTKQNKQDGWTDASIEDGDKIFGKKKYPDPVTKGKKTTDFEEKNYFKNKNAFGVGIDYWEKWTRPDTDSSTPSDEDTLNGRFYDFNQLTDMSKINIMFLNKRLGSGAIGTMDYSFLLDRLGLSDNLLSKSTDKIKDDGGEIDYSGNGCYNPVDDITNGNATYLTIGKTVPLLSDKNSKKLFSTPNDIIRK